MLQNRKNVLDKAKTELADSINRANIVYNNEELSALLQEQIEKNNQQQEKINNLEKQMNEVSGKVYPVGSIYISYSSTNPSSLFGGTWVAYGTGRTLVGVDTSQSEFNTVGKTGGEKAHTLTVNEMPAHEHVGVYYSDGRPISFTTHGGQNSGYFTNYQSVENVNPNYIHTGMSGGGKGHNNLQPYITVYMWRRTA